MEAPPYLHYISTKVHNDRHFGFAFLLIFVHLQYVRAVNFLPQIAVSSFEAFGAHIYKSPFRSFKHSLSAFANGFKRR